MTKAQIARVLAKIKKHRESIATHRNALREIYRDIKSEASSISVGIDHLDKAIDSLSEYLQGVPMAEIEVEDDCWSCTTELSNGHAECLSVSLDDEGLSVSVTLMHRRGHVEQESITIPREHVQSLVDWLNTNHEPTF